jgi:hypothetical protein
MWSSVVGRNPVFRVAAPKVPPLKAEALRRERALPDESDDSEAHMSEFVLRKDTPQLEVAPIAPRTRVLMLT